MQRCGWRRREGVTEDLVDDLRLSWLMLRHLSRMIVGKDLEERGEGWEEMALVMPGTGAVQALWPKLSKQFRNVGKTKDNMNI